MSQYAYADDLSDMRIDGEFRPWPFLSYFIWKCRFEARENVWLDWVKRCPRMAPAFLQDRIIASGDWDAIENDIDRLGDYFLPDGF